MGGILLVIATTYIGERKEFDVSEQEDFYICCKCKKLINGMRAVVEEEDDYCLDCFHANFTDEKVGEA